MFLANICAYVLIFARASLVNFVYFISFLLYQNRTGMPMCSDQYVKSVSSLEKDKQTSKGELWCLYMQMNEECWLLSYPLGIPFAAK